MKYRNSDDNRYRVQFMKSTEELMNQLTVKEFISYLEEKAEFEDYTVEYIDGKCVNCKAYDLKEESSNLHKEFLVTEDGRVFYWLSLVQKVELEDKEENEKVVETYVFTNPHPEGKIVSDCVKRAVCLTTGMSYKETSNLLNKIKREIGEKDYNSKKCCNEYVKRFGWKKISFPAEKGKPRMNGQKFAEQYPKGNYILNMAGHWSCCKDGVIYDTWDCREKCVYTAFEVKK